MGKDVDDTTVKDIRNLLRLKSKIKQSKIERLHILGTFLSMKKTIINQQEEVNFGKITVLKMKILVIEIQHCQLKNMLLELDHT